MVLWYDLVRVLMLTFFLDFTVLQEGSIVLLFLVVRDRASGHDPLRRSMF